MEKPDFTWIQILNYIAYENVRSSGICNMFDPNAQIAAGLSNEDYVFVMKNYDALRAQYEDEHKGE